MKKAAIVILNWNGKDLLKQFLPVLIANTPLEKAEIIVADNASTDSSVDFLRTNFPEVQLIELNENYGFAEGYNRALSELDNEYVVLLNSDVEVTPGWFDKAFDYLEQHPEVSALQPKILSYKERDSFEYAGAAGGFLDKYGYPFCRGRIFGSIEKDTYQYEETIDVFWVSGACMFIRLQDFKEIGGFDKTFFAHQEEIDLCWRLNKRGCRLVCYPPSVVYHVGGATLDAENPHKTFLNFRNNLLMLYKNLPEKTCRKVMFIRFFLDYLAAFQFFLSGKRKDAQAVWKARHDFCNKKETYRNIKRSNQNQSTDNIPDKLFNKSILYHYYIGRKNTFSGISE